MSQELLRHTNEHGNNVMNSPEVLSSLGYAAARFEVAAPVDYAERPLGFSVAERAQELLASEGVQ